MKLILTKRQLDFLCDVEIKMQKQAQIMRNNEKSKDDFKSFITCKDMFNMRDFEEFYEILGDLIEYTRDIKTKNKEKSKTIMERRKKDPYYARPKYIVAYRLMKKENQKEGRKGSLKLKDFKNMDEKTLDLIIATYKCF